MSDRVEVINGARTSFGPMHTVKDTPYEAGDVIKHIVAQLLTVAGDANLLAAAVANDATQIKIPANSFIYDGYLNVKTAFTATTAVSITVGSETDANGLIEAGGAGAKAALTANSWQVIDGALLASTWGTADEALVASWNAADSTAAGEGALVVFYIPPLLG